MAIKKETVLKALTDKQHARLVADIRKLDDGLDFCIALSAIKRRNISKMGEVSLPFVERTSDYAEQFPEIVPQYLDMDQFHQNLKLAKQLRDLKMKLLPVLEKINDTYCAAGSEALGAARQIYKYTKASLEDGKPVSGVFAELKTRYQRPRRKTKTVKNDTPITEPTAPDPKE